VRQVVRVGSEEMQAVQDPVTQPRLRGGAGGLEAGGLHTQSIIRKAPAKGNMADRDFLPLFSLSSFPHFHSP